MAGIGPSDSANFIEKAITRPGALGKKAKAAGMSTQKFASKHLKGNSRTAKESRFAKFLNKVRPKK